MKNQRLLNEVLEKLNRKRKKHRITNIDIMRDIDVLPVCRMDIDGKRFRIAKNGSYRVEEVEGGCLVSNEAARKISKELEA